MANEVVYVKAYRNTEVFHEDVFLKDVAEVRCSNSQISAKVRSIKVHHFGKDVSPKCVISILKIIEFIENACPDVTVESLGEADFLVEIVRVNKHKGWQQACKAALVCFVSFFGTAFTIMAFHNDIGIRDIFAEMLDSIPIFSRRIGFRHGLGMAILAMALGKLAGSFFYFWWNITPDK